MPAMMFGSASDPSGRIVLNDNRRYAIQHSQSMLSTGSASFTRTHSHLRKSIPMEVVINGEVPPRMATA